VLLRWQTPDGDEDLVGPCDPMKLRDVLVNDNLTAADPMVEPDESPNPQGESEGGSSVTDSGTDETYWEALLDVPWNWPEN